MQEFVILITPNCGIEALVLAAVRNEVSKEAFAYSDRLGQTTIVAHYSSDSSMYEDELQETVFDIAMGVEGVARVEVLRKIDI